MGVVIAVLDTREGSATWARIVSLHDTGSEAGQRGRWSRVAQEGRS